MNYELSAEVIKILDDLGKRFGVAIDWADKNVMPYLMDLYERFIDYKIVINLIPIILFVIFLIAGIIYTVKFFKYKNLAFKTEEDNILVKFHKYNYKPSEWNMTDFGFVISAIIVIGLSIFGLFTIFCFEDLLKLIFVPELYMVDYLSTYM